MTARLYIALGFICLGIAAGWEQVLSPAAAMSALLIGAGIVAGRRAPTIALALVCLGAGALSAGLRATRSSALSELATHAPECEVAGSVTESSSLGSFARLSYADCEGQAVADPGTAVIVDDPPDAGEHFEASGFLTPLRDDSFDAARRRLGADAVLSPHRIVVSGEKGIAGGSLAFRRSLARSSRALSPRTAAMLLGLTIGDTNGFDEPTLDAFRASGLAHLLAVSGTNVSIVVGTLALALRRSRIAVRLVASGAVLAFYVLVVGPDASVLRAAAMGAVGLAALFWGHRPEPLNALAVALTIVLLLRPALLFSVGLHLSAAATAGLVLWAGPFATRLSKWMPRLVAWPLGATLAAQIAVAPILILVFGRVSIVAPVANLLAVPAVTPGTVLGLLSGVAGLVGPVPGALIAHLAGPPSAWIVRCADFFGTRSWAQLQVGPVEGWALLALVAGAGLITARRSLGVLD